MHIEIIEAKAFRTFITMQQTEVIQNHETENFRSIEIGEVRQKQ
jgi:hypothetical protein